MSEKTDFDRVVQYVQDYGLPKTREEISEAQSLIVVYGVDIAAALYVLKHGLTELSVDHAIEYLKRP